MDNFKLADVADMLDRFFLQSLDVSQKFPPYSIGRHKSNPNEYLLQLALAGFSEKDITVVLERNILTIKSNDDIRPSFEDDNYLYYNSGVAKRKFVRRFTLFNDGPTEVLRALLKDGILTIYLKKIVPEADRPKSIPINAVSSLDAPATGMYALGETATT